MAPRSLVALALAAALLAGCAAPASAEVAPPAAAPGGLPDDALAAYAAAVMDPADRPALRRALDQVELALAVAPAAHPQRGALVAAEADLVSRLAPPVSEEPPEQGQGPAEPPPAETAAAVVSPVTDSPAPTSAPTAPPAPTSAPTAPPAAPRPRPTAQPIPPAPTFAIATRTSFDGSGVSGQFASCIDVQVLGRAGPVGGAVIGINNGEHSYQDQTDAGGYSGRCGLGASTWSVVLFWAPGGGPAQPVATTVYVSGAPEQRAAVVFQER